MASTSISGISFSGLVSGVDTDSIISKLMSLQRIPQTLIQNKGENYAATKAVYSELATALNELRDAAAAINDIADPLFEKRAATSLQPAIADAAITGAAPSLGTYQLTVMRLAVAAMAGSAEALYTGTDVKAQPAKATSSSGINAPSQTVNPTLSLAAQSGALATAADASGTITVNGVELAWDSSMTVNEIVGRINNLGAGATAAFDAATQTITLSSNALGSAAQLEIGETSGNLLEVFNLSAGTTTGTDAVQTDLSAALGSGDAHLDRAVTSGTFTINGVIFNVDAATDTLQSVLVRINSSNAGVTANYNSSTGRVALTQNETGSANAIVLGADGDSSNILYALKLSTTNPPVGGASDTYTGTDAEASLNGGPAQTFSSNSVDELITGVTVSLHGLGSTTVQVEADVDGMVEKISAFVDKYNAVMDYINTKTREARAEDPTTAEERIQGTFAGDRTFLDAKADLTSIVNSVVGGLPNTLNQLAQIGITGSAENFGKDAVLELDADKLKAALVADPAAVGKIFDTSTTGIMSQMTAKLKSMTDFVDGTLTIETKGLDASITQVNERVAAMEELLVQREASLKMQFANMETMVATLKSNGDRLTSLMANSTS